MKILQFSWNHKPVHNLRHQKLMVLVWCWRPLKHYLQPFFLFFLEKLANSYKYMRRPSSMLPCDLCFLIIRPQLTGVYDGHYVELQWSWWVAVMSSLTGLKHSHAGLMNTTDTKHELLPHQVSYYQLSPGDLSSSRGRTEDAGLWKERRFRLTSLLQRSWWTRQLVFSW